MVKRSIDYLARAFVTARYTIYNYLTQICAYGTEGNPKYKANLFAVIVGEHDK